MLGQGEVEFCVLGQKQTTPVYQAQRLPCGGEHITLHIEALEDEPCQEGEGADGEEGQEQAPPVEGEEGICGKGGKLKPRRHQQGKPGNHGQDVCQSGDEDARRK